MEKEKVTSNTILDWVKEQVENKKLITKDGWLDIAFKLNSFLLEETETFNLLHSEVAKKKLAILRSQEKRNVAMVEVEIEASEEYLKMRNQQAKVDNINQFIMIAKKNSDVGF